MLLRLAVRAAPTCFVNAAKEEAGLGSGGRAATTDRRHVSRLVLARRLVKNIIKFLNPCAVHSVTCVYHSNEAFWTGEWTQGWGFDASKEGGEPGSSQMRWVSREVPSLIEESCERSRDIKELHRQAAEELGLAEEAVEEVERLLSELQQLLVGISIMQVIGPPPLYSPSTLTRRPWPRTWCLTWFPERQD